MASGTTHVAHDHEPLSLELQPIEPQAPWIQYSRSVRGSVSEATSHVDNSHASTAGSFAEGLPTEAQDLVRHHPVTLYDPPHTSHVKQSDEASDVPLLAPHTRVSQAAEAQSVPFCVGTSSDATHDLFHDVTSPGQGEVSYTPVGNSVSLRSYESDVSFHHQLADPEDSLRRPPTKSSRQRHFRFKSWKVGITMGAVMSAAVLCTNTTFFCGRFLPLNMMVRWASLMREIARPYLHGPSGFMLLLTV